MYRSEAVNDNLILSIRYEKLDILVSDWIGFIKNITNYTLKIRIKMYSDF